MILAKDSEVCPTEEDLGEFLLGKQGDAQLESIARHLEGCRKCSEKARSLESRTDGLVDTLRLAISEGANAGEPPRDATAPAVASSGLSTAHARVDNGVQGEPLRRLRTYELLEEIGRGGTGVVFRARHTRLKTIVAVKVLPPEALTRPDVLARFNREMAAIGRLVHPHIVHATDADEVDGQHFLVMEYVQGGDFATLVRRQGPLPIAEAVTCALHAAQGLAYAHDQGMIHRDVKPSNLLLGDGVVKISDLGLARVLLNVDEEGSTHTGSLMGTFDYMAPEQAVNAKLADERADVYGLGCTLYFLLTGRPPFASDSALETLIAHREQLPPLVRRVRPETPRQLDRLVQRLLAKSPSDRPRSMQQVVRELESLREKGVVPVAEDLCCLLSNERPRIELTHPQRFRRQPHRGRRASVYVAAAAGAIVGALLGVVFLRFWAPAGEPRLPPSTAAARFDVRLVRAADGVQVRHLQEAVNLLAGELPSQSVDSGRFRFLDFIDPAANSGGFFDFDIAFPGSSFDLSAENGNHFALEAVASVFIPRGGVWTFCVVSDDGFQLSVDGEIVGKHPTSRTQAASLIPIEFPEPGIHVLELIYFEGAGGADLEFSVAEGSFDDFDAEAFRLVGASYEGGLPLIRPK